MSSSLYIIKVEFGYKGWMEEYTLNNRKTYLYCNGGWYCPKTDTKIEDHDFLDTLRDEYYRI